jgi:hypothetical protein
VANHLRRQIREAVATLLTGLTTTGNRVFKSRVQTLQDNQLPALVILTNEETVTQSTIHSNPLLERQLSVQVIAKAKANTNLDDTLDQIIKEVEMAVFASNAANTLGGLVKGLVLDSIDITFNGEAETKVGEAVMAFTAVYFNQAATPDVSV